MQPVVKQKGLYVIVVERVWLLIDHNCVTEHLETGFKGGCQASTTQTDGLAVSAQAGDE